MKIIFSLLLSLLVVCGAACVPENKEDVTPDNGGENNTTNDDPAVATLTFEISLRLVTWDSATVDITPSNDTDTYHFGLVEKAAYDAYDSDKVFIRDRVADLEARCELEGCPLSELLTQYADGWHYDKELTPETEYCVYVFGLTGEGVVTTELTTLAFTTMAVGGSVGDDPVGIDNGDTNVEGLVWGSYIYLGDFYGVGDANWRFFLNNFDGTGTFTIELQTDLSVVEPPLGEFQILQSFDAGVAIAGALNYMDYIYGTYWVCYDNAAEQNTVQMALCQSGMVIIDREGDNFIINVDAIDEFGNSIKASYSGELYNNTPTF